MRRNDEQNEDETKGLAVSPARCYFVFDLGLLAGAWGGC
jgi:hypothetical protein